MFNRKTQNVEKIRNLKQLISNAFLICILNYYKKYIGMIMKNQNPNPPKCGCSCSCCCTCEGGDCC